MNHTKRISSPPNGRQMLNEVQERVARVPQQLTECVDDRPLASVSVAFSVGLIAGAGLVALYCQTQRQSQTSSYESLAQRVADAVRSAIPQQLSSFR